MQYIYIVTSRECINNLFFHILNSRQAIFIYSIRSKAVDLFTFFYFINIFVCWILPTLCCWYHSLLFPLFNSYVFQQWWTIVGGIKIVILFYKVHSKPERNEKKCLSKRLFRSTQTFSDYKPGVIFNENRYLPGLLTSYSRLFHAKAQHNVVFNTFLKDCI